MVFGDLYGFFFFFNFYEFVVVDFSIGGMKMILNYFYFWLWDINGNMVDDIMFIKMDYIGLLIVSYFWNIGVMLIIFIGVWMISVNLMLKILCKLLGL